MATVAQAYALAHVRGRGEAARPAALDRIAAALARSNLAASSVGGGLRPPQCPPIGTLLDHLARARVTLNFHPDRLRRDGVTVAEGLLREGKYKSQFETGVTSGSPTAFPGGDRDRWEEALFGGAYQAAGVAPAERPKYGALDLMAYPDGGSPRFGSTYLVLRAHVTGRSTFTWGDSYESPEHVGTAEVLEPLLAALIESVEATGGALGTSGLDVARLLDLLASHEARAARDPASGTPGRALDACIEAQVHGDVDLAADVEAIVTDPSFAGTPTGEHLQEMAARHSVSLRFHAGFVLPAHDVPADFRGPRVVPVAHRVGERHATVPGLLDAATIGRAAAELERHPDAFHDLGTPPEVWQLLKQLWHVLVRFGRATR